MSLLKQYIFTLLLLFSSQIYAQQIKIGNYTFPVGGGEYQGEMFKGKPYGKGTTKYPNGDFHTGNYVKGKREGHGIYQFSDGEKYERNRSMLHFVCDSRYKKRLSLGLVSRIP